MATIYLCEIEEGVFLKHFINKQFYAEYVTVIEVYEDDKERTPEYMASKKREKDIRNQLSDEHKIQFNIKHPKK